MLTEKAGLLIVLANLSRRRCVTLAGRSHRVLTLSRFWCKFGLLSPIWSPGASFAAAPFKIPFT